MSQVTRMKVDPVALTGFVRRAWEQQDVEAINSVCPDLMVGDWKLIGEGQAAFEAHPHDEGFQIRHTGLPATVKAV